jgi:polyisoprenyl-phosphate glycosyltransferase
LQPAKTYETHSPRNVEVTRQLISLLVTLYDEAENVAALLASLERVAEGLDFDVEVVAVNDGSRDATLAALQAYRPSAFSLVVVDLSRNFGKEAALTAGLAYVRGEAVIPLDADLQDPPELIPQLLAQWQGGFEVVLARRSDRSSDGFMKRTSAHSFYKVINGLSDVAIPEDVGDFRLMDRAVVEVLRELPESRRFMKGLLAWAGFRTTVVDYVRPPRAAGESKFNGWRLWNLALEGVTSFSTFPLRVWTYVGFAIAALSFLYGTVIVLRTLIAGVDVPGYASLLVVILFLGGVQLIGLGIMGEYLGRSYLEAKRRPPFVVRAVMRNGERVALTAPMRTGIGDAIDGR